MVDAAVETISRLVRAHAARMPGKLAVVVGDKSATYQALDLMADRVANALHREGCEAGDVVATVTATGMESIAFLVGATRAGAILAPLPASADPGVLTTMLLDSGAKVCLVDPGVPLAIQNIVTIGGDGPAFDAWVGDACAAIEDVPANADAPATIIYSSGTTGKPKGIVQSHRYRSGLLVGGSLRGYDAMSVTLLATPLYSNTTLASLLPTIGSGGTVVLMEKFDAGEWLELAERYGVTHAMLVPVMIERILSHADFDRRDLSSFKAKYCTSAPFAAATKKAVLERWPGDLVEIYGMTEGGAAFILPAHEFPDKLHTVGRPVPGSEIRILDENDQDVAPGTAGEVVGRSLTMMIGYHNRPDATADIRWRDPDGIVWQRTGDIGWIDEDGFLTIVDRKKDMIISGGFNIFPADIEAVLHQHPAVREAAVVGVPDTRWGETPVAFVVAEGVTGETIRQWVNERIGKMQRIADAVLVDSLPRGAIGKVLKRDLRDGYKAA